ncbi:MAG: hypothetical protein IT167_23525 [Bryobacterales bacterium]|nr:hypothetical protein [Bryobacterales bacterium]
MMRLLEVLLHGGSQLSGWRTARSTNPCAKPLASPRSEAAYHKADAAIQKLADLVAAYPR